MASRILGSVDVPVFIGAQIEVAERLSVMSEPCLWRRPSLCENQSTAVYAMHGEQKTWHATGTFRSQPWCATHMSDAGIGQKGSPERDFRCADSQWVAAFADGE